MLRSAVIPIVDPEMSLERLSCQCMREFDEEASLPLQTESEGSNSGGISRLIRPPRQGLKIHLCQ
jgi:hypothetical protein